MLTIRLFRIGKKHQPFFRIVVADKKNSCQAGKFLEIVGFYNPLTKEKNLKLERIKYWLSVGAKPSSTVQNLLLKNGILKGKKIPKHKKSKKTKETIPETITKTPETTTKTIKEETTNSNPIK